MLSQTNPRSRKDNLVIQELKGEILIYDLDKDKAFCLNETSAQIWDACDGLNSVADISRLLGEKHHLAVDEDFVWLALHQLKQKNLLSGGEDVVPNFNAMTRRELTKKVGISTMLAIPLILSIKAPLAAQSNSTCGSSTNKPPGCPCAKNDECRSNKCNKTTNRCDA